MNLINVVKINEGNEFMIYYKSKILCGPYHISDKDVILEAVNAAIKIIAKQN